MTLFVKFIYFIFILIPDFKMLQCGTSPKLKWPLCDLSFTYETIKKGDGIFPNLDDCFEVDDGPKFTSNAEGKGLFYNGSTFSRVNLLPELKDTDFGFSIFVKPRILKGCVLHYKTTSSSSSYSYITDVLLCFDGNLNYTIKNSYENTLGVIDNFQITVDSWSLLQVGFGYNKIVMSVGDGTFTSHQLSTSVKFKKEGTITVGNSHDKNQGFVGALTCLMAFDDAGAFPTKSENEEQCAQKSKWGSPPSREPTCLLSPSYEEPTTQATTTTTTTTPTPPPPTTTTSSTQSLLRVWPLDNKAYGYETILNTEPSVTDLSSCPRIECNDSVFPFPALLFDGAAGSHIKTYINQTIFLKRFTVGLFIYPGKAPSGTILHIIDDGNVVVPGVSELRIDINMCDLTVTVQLTGGQSCITTLKTNKTKISEWSKLVISRNIEDQQMSVTLNNETMTIQDTCSTSNLSRSSELFIGRSSESFTSFRGYIRCLAFFDSVLNPDLETICTSEPVSAFNTSDIECEAATMNWMYFKKMYGLMRPDVGKPEIERMGVKQLKSCAVNCLISRFCRSFVYDFSQKLCFLYDFVTSNGLVDYDTGNYYIVINKLQKL